jgi:hypothetical protein
MRLLSVLLLGSVLGCQDDPRFQASVDGCFIDGDGDGYGDLSVTGDCSDPDAVPVAGDCDDTNTLIGPEAVEVCDEIDNDCDGGIDEDAADAAMLYLDADSDGYGGTDFAEVRCEGTPGWVSNSDDCDDLETTVYPGAFELCGDGIDNDCDGLAESDCVESLDGVAFYGQRDDEGVGTVDAGDLNGDGIDDVLIGAYASSNGDGLNNDGTAYIFFGPHQASRILDEADVVIEGGFEEKDTLGWGVATPGDIDGDGIGDVLVSASQAEHPDGYDRTGSVYFFSGAGLSSGMVLSSDDADAEWYGESKTYLGADIYGANLDGDDAIEVIAGATWADGERGRIYLLDDSPEPGLHDILEAAQATITGAEEGDHLGRSASIAAADLDGDGIGDLLVGQPLLDQEAGALYLIAGPVSGDMSITDADALIQSAGAEDMLGRSVALAGDTDGDGLTDFLVSAPDADDPATDSGSVYLVVSRPDLSSFHTERITTVSDAWISGVDANDHIGTALSGGRDINGDGHADVLFGGDEIGFLGDTGAYLFYGPMQGVLSAGRADAIYAEASNNPGSLALVSQTGDGGGLLLNAQFDDLGADDGGATWLMPSPE